MAFANGAELWILPDGKHSTWAKKIDWYLNFQAARAATHEAPKLAAGLLQLLQEVQLSPPTTSAHVQAPLMISTSHRLPARHAVLIPYEGQLKSWLKQVQSIWQQMGYPTARIFLPLSQSFNQCLEVWDSSEGNNISVVMDDGHTQNSGD